MLKLLTKKWWVILIQGILMIILAIYIFNNPFTVLKGVSIWIAVVIILVGLSGIVSSLSVDEEKKEGVSLLWSIITAGFGILLLFNLFSTMKIIALIFGLWTFLTGIHLINLGVGLKKDHFFGWLIIIVALVSIIAGIMMIADIGTGAIGISILLGIQILLTGIVLVIFSIVEKIVIKKVKEKIRSINPQMYQ